MKEKAKLRCFLALVHAPGLRLSLAHQLINQVSDLSGLFSGLQTGSLSCYPKLYQSLSQVNWLAVDRDLSWLSLADDHSIITFDDPLYPPLLKQIGSPPLVLFCRGNAELLSTRQLAIVGSRKTGEMGLKEAHYFSSQLAGNGLTITSGLALGIDSAAHRGALYVAGHTIAVMATGLDRVYPPRHQRLADQIVSSGGLLVSEFSITTPPKRQHFPQRNRLISGLSLGVMVVQAALASGSLITARMAIEQNRLVFVLPGSRHEFLSKGNHQLLREGACLVTDVSDVIDELPGFDRLLLVPNEKDLVKEGVQLTSTQAKVMQRLTHLPTSLSELQSQLDLEMSVLLVALAELKMLDLIICEASGYLRNGIISNCR